MKKITKEQYLDVQAKIFNIRQDLGYLMKEVAAMDIHEDHHMGIGEVSKTLLKIECVLQDEADGMEWTTL